MSEKDFLIYSAKEPMVILRKKFNQGESLYKSTPDSISQIAALEDSAYVRFVLEEAYSGYDFYDKALFDTAFEAIECELRGGSKNVQINDLIDLIANNLSFINDGHLCLGTENHGKGFYERLDTYVSDILLTENNGSYIDITSGEKVELNGDNRLFQTISDKTSSAFLVGKRSKKPLDKIKLLIGGNERVLDVHKIKSKQRSEKILITDDYDTDVAYITCPSFIGDSEEDFNKFEEIGIRCRNYKNIILDLSNNLGGNSEFPKRFLKGLNGGFNDTTAICELKSTLVHAKECGEIKSIPRHLKNSSDQDMSFIPVYEGTLHIIINDRVASSAENAIIMAQSLKNVLFYGCNSMGIGRFGDLCIYYLPNSQVTLWCPQKIFESIIEETVGFEPDFWVDSYDVTSIIKNHIKRQLV